MSKLKLFAMLAFTMATSAQAHDRWILPTHFSVSAEDKVWIMADVTASNETFNVDKPMGSDRFTIIKPNGERSRPSSSYRGHRKSVVDIHLTEEGTYKLYLDSNVSYWTSYEISGKEGTQWLRNVSKANRADKLPKGAKNVTTLASQAQVMTFVTLNAPNDNYSLTNNGLELKPITHPSDIAQNEKAQLQLLFNGKPQQGVEVEIIKDGARYRNDLNALKVVSDNNGEISFTLADAGRYLLVAEFKKSLTHDALADEMGGQIFFTFEAVLN
ncbi:DUF4198 domain-containing protein [Pseudoalteromonas aurantia]|uniref:DUF4198 domain-containing protein n=2 Tax=Pseudoalteromonas TaxID=53246 RepID=A0A5S3V0B5_9GAMM|nr:DUF4198 domain-containing protein [Pseudoalteromonas aurantia]TMO56110.1 DUF4198 domain-containing protein [Pseudoalteromonas aurantia]TMO63010.1 DUF4198 domain-containing protein [Pseudoalteromonas aurantia]TMO69292.1 DUF4198 domain-containing protein [Pseudoalteromonas aurantia]